MKISLRLNLPMTSGSHADDPLLKISFATSTSTTVDGSIINEDHFCLGQTSVIAKQQAGWPSILRPPNAVSRSTQQAAEHPITDSRSIQLLNSIDDDDLALSLLRASSVSSEQMSHLLDNC